MRKHIFKTMLIAGGLSALCSFASLAGQWQQDTVGWWYQNDDGNYPTNCWQEIDGKQYYFGADGYMLSNTTTPDGSKVGPDGSKRRIVIKSRKELDGSYSTIEVDLTELSSQYSINPVIIEEMNSTFQQIWEKYNNNSGPVKSINGIYYSDLKIDNSPFDSYSFPTYVEPISGETYFDPLAKPTVINAKGGVAIIGFGDSYTTDEIANILVALGQSMAREMYYGVISTGPDFGINVGCNNGVSTSNDMWDFTSKD